MTGSNPNVYLEIGYAWAKGVPTILIVKSSKATAYDLRGHTGHAYKSIISLQKILAEELAHPRLIPGVSSESANAPIASKASAHVFVSLPRTDDVEDIFHFGIKQPLASVGTKL